MSEPTLDQWKAMAVRLSRQARRNWLQSPAFPTFAELKHGPAGAVLASLQDGEISRGRAAEALAQLFHGQTDVELPGAADSKPSVFSMDELPAEVVTKLREQIEQLRKVQAAALRWKMSIESDTVSDALTEELEADLFTALEEREMVSAGPATPAPTEPKDGAR